MISVVTPSFRQLDWLRLCVASVADQTDVELEHIVQDAGSGFARADLPTSEKLQLVIEKDAGMYDAINRGLRRARGEICAYLNCDEQYLPGALAQVASAFARDPQLDVLLAGSIVVDGEGRYICSRPALKPSLHHLRAGRMYNLTSSIFFRSRLIRDKSLYFDPELRIVGDRDWFRRVVESGARFTTLAAMTSTFSDLGTNLALSLDASAEGAADRSATSSFREAIAVASHRFARLMAGHYRLPPFEYSIYTPAHPTVRETFRVPKPTGVWHNRI